MTSDQSDGAVVTGAASGIDRAIAAALAKDGFSVVIGDLDEANGRAAAKEIAAANKGRAIFQRVDVTDRRSVSAAIETCTRQFGSIKVMVNNAGFNKPEPFLEASEAIWQKIMDVNALGVMIGIQEAAKAMIAAGTKGKIINTASIAGRTGYADPRAAAAMFNGWVTAHSGKISEGILLVEQGLSAWQRIGIQHFLPRNHCLLAEAYLAGQRYTEALAQVSLASATERTNCAESPSWWKTMFAGR